MNAHAKEITLEQSFSATTGMSGTVDFPAVRAESVPAAAWWTALAAAWAVLCIPLLVVEVPPLTDYPNHLARAAVMASLGSGTFLDSVYAAHWGIIPDLAIDSFMPWAVSVMPAHTAGRLLLSLILLLDVAGAASCAAALHGRRTWWSLGAALAAYNLAFLMGFLNFDLTLGAGMVAAAAWIRIRKRASPAAAAAVGTAVTGTLYFGHLMGLFFCVMLMGSFEASLLWDRLRRTGWAPARAVRAAVASWPVMVPAIPVAILYRMSGLHGAGGGTAWLPWDLRLMHAMSSFINYDISLDLATVAAVLVFLAACAATRRLRIAPGAVFALVVIGIMFPLLPHDLKGTSYVAMRLAVMFGFLVFIAFRPVPGPRTAAAAALVFAGLFAVRTATVATVWWDYRTDVSDARALMSYIREGDRVTEIDIDPSEVESFYERVPRTWHLSNDQITYYHLFALMVFERRAFWPSLFSDPNQQPFIDQPYWQRLADSTLTLPSWHALSMRRVRDYPPAQNPFCAFDWVILHGTWLEKSPDTLSPDWLTLISSNRTAALYRVRNPRSCSMTPTASLSGAGP